MLAVTVQGLLSLSTGVGGNGSVWRAVRCAGVQLSHKASDLEVMRRPVSLLPALVYGQSM